MDKKYGSPELSDATADLDRMVNDASKWFMEMVREIGPRVLNRPLGSVPVKPEAQLADFQAVYQDTAKLAQIHAERMQQMGQKQGTVDFIRWYKRNQKRLNNG